MVERLFLWVQKSCGTFATKYSIPLTREVTDQMGRRVRVPRDPRRIISLVPSQTELLFDLDLRDRLVGVTKFCVHPRDLVREKHKIGGTKKFNFAIIDDLKPDLIIGNKEENYKEGIETLSLKYPVWVSDILSLHDAYAMMGAIGEIFYVQEKVLNLQDRIKESLTSLSGRRIAKRALYFIWRNPWMVAAGGTFIDEMLRLAGFENVVGNLKRYPELQPDQIRDLDPEVILLSSEPFPFKEKHRLEIQDILPGAKIILADGEMFSWYGSRLQYAAGYFTKLHQLLN